MKNWKLTLKTLNCYSRHISSAEPSTNQHRLSHRPLPVHQMTFTRDRHLWPLQDSNTQSQQANSHRPTCWTVQLPGSAKRPICDHTIK